MFSLVIAASFLFSSQPQVHTDNPSNVRTVKFCDLAQNPAAYNQELIRLTGFVTHGFEDFQISEPDCASSADRFSVWLMYGGKTPSGTIYCCPGEGGQGQRKDTLTVEGIEVPLSEDQAFKAFNQLLAREPDTTVRVTAVGRFFAGEKQGPTSNQFLRGYGHMGCCSLFVIQTIEDFAPHTRADLDYTAEAGSYEREGCKYNSESDAKHVSVSYGRDAAKQAIAEQQLADLGERAWAFQDPQRVALESLKDLYRGQMPALREIKGSASRKVYLWKRSHVRVIVVVTRPYWLSLYAKSGSVVWVSTTIKEVQCQ